MITPSSHLINPGLTKYEAEYEATCGAENYVSPRFEPKKLSFRLGSDFKSVIFAPFGFKICYLKMYVRTFLLGTVPSQQIFEVRLHLHKLLNAGFLAVHLLLRLIPAASL